jgi:hypothetical protein
MNENVKTLTLVAVAAGVVVLAIVTRPSLPGGSQESLTNQSLYKDFTDPLAVTNLEITEYDEGRGEVLPFQVAQVQHKGKALWSIPSHDDYPADAKDQVASAAGGLMGLKVIEMVSDNQGDQREYGVIDPDPKALKAGQTGVGERVVMKDKDGKTLLALVIGKEVKDRPGLRYVRKVGESPIYVVEAKTDKLSTKFENWIERNLLQISSFDIKQVEVRDHSVDVMRGALYQRGDTAVEYNDSGEPKWKLIEDKKFAPLKDRPDEGQWVPVKLAPDQELNSAKLDELKTALDDLKIVDVSRKPAGLSTDLKAAADFKNHRDSVESLAQKGFFAAELTKGQTELFSNEGEIRVTMKDGVEYVLRFGGIAGTSPTKKDDKAKGKTAGKEPEKKEGAGLSRYLFVMAEFNPNVISKPQFEPLPEVKKEPAAKPAEAKKPVEEKKPAEEKKAAPAAAKEKKPADKKADEKKPDAKKADEKKPEAKKPEAKAADKKPEPAKPVDPAKAAEAEKAAKAERERIEKENKRKQEEYDQKVADGKKRVGELNNRFADWYYVISDEVYRKIHFTHDELFKKKEKGKAKKDEHAGHDHGPGDTAADPLEMLKNQGPASK